MENDLLTCPIALSFDDTGTRATKYLWSGNDNLLTPPAARVFGCAETAQRVNGLWKNHHRVFDFI